MTDHQIALGQLIFAGMQALGILVLIYQVYDSYHWNKLRSDYNFINVGDSSSLQERLYAVLERFGAYGFPEKCKPLTPEEVDLVSADKEGTFVVNSYLNYLQNLCTAHSLGLVSDKAFKAIHAGRITWWYTVLLPYIERKREEYQNPEIWHHFVNCSNEHAKLFNR